MAASLLACGPREQTSLVDLTRFEVVSGTAEDPFRSYGSDPRCPLASAAYELFGGEPAFGIESTDCAFVTIAQPAATHVDEGELLRFRLWHFELTAPLASSATIAMALDGTVVHEFSLPIPSDSGLDVPRFFSPVSIDEGAPLHFHIRNHGSNAYALLEITVGGE